MEYIVAVLAVLAVVAFIAWRAKKDKNTGPVETGESGGSKPAEEDNTVQK